MPSKFFAEVWGRCFGAGPLPESAYASPRIGLRLSWGFTLRPFTLFAAQAVILLLDPTKDIPLVLSREVHVYICGGRGISKNQPLTINN
jgi:hypothetical protein